MAEETRRQTAKEPPAAVAVLGVGTMGSAVAQRLLGAGMTVVVWDRNPRTAASVAAAGAKAVDDPKAG